MDKSKLKQIQSDSSQATILNELIHWTDEEVERMLKIRKQMLIDAEDTEYDDSYDVWKAESVDRNPDGWAE
tara:strand:- start:90 stop:302 length:213 start_codon:yes stop_codon:yes gene_type:complete